MLVSSSLFELISNYYSLFKRSCDEHSCSHVYFSTYRESIFRQNVRYIHSKNRSPITYTLAVNHITDLSKVELKMMNGRRPSKGYNGGQPFNKNAYTVRS